MGYHPRAKGTLLWTKVYTRRALRARETAARGVYWPLYLRTSCRRKINQTSDVKEITVE
jgi:hypothetical protein